MHFFVYLVLYAGFVVLNAVAPEVMETKPVAGLNLAVLYGFGLILAAFVLAIVYGGLAERADRLAAAEQARTAEHSEANGPREGEQ